jgi:hypothetical protein
MVVENQESPVYLEQMDLVPILGLAQIIGMRASSVAGLVAEAHADPDPAQLCMRMFYVLQALGQHAFALDMQAIALRQRRCFRIAGAAPPHLRLLALMAPGDMCDSTPFEFITHHLPVRLDLLYLLPDGNPPRRVPDHDVLVVAVGESQKNFPLLEQAGRLLKHWPRPVLNPPGKILGCARDAVYRSLRGLPGVCVAHTWRVARGRLGHIDLPATIRPLDSQAGHGLTRLETPADLPPYLEAHDAAFHYVARYVEYASPDGLYRKYRVALIDGRPYACHLAIMDRWMVHYIPARMELSEAKRREEAWALEHFDTELGLRHGAAFSAIAARLGLDHVVLDCAELPDGRLLVFEADTRGWIHATDPLDLFPGKAAVMQKAFDAFEDMLRRRIASAQQVAGREPRR